jgi:hypothetical protein
MYRRLLDAAGVSLLISVCIGAETAEIRLLSTIRLPTAIPKPAVSMGLPS